MPLTTQSARLRHLVAGLKRGRMRIRVPERALLGAAMSGALLIAEKRLNRMQSLRESGDAADARTPKAGE